MNLSLNKIQFNASFINQWFLAAASISVMGVFFSRAMISIGMIGIVLLYFFNKGWKKPFHFDQKNLILFFLAPIFVLYLIGGLWTKDYGYWMDRVQVKIPLLFVPLGFWAVSAIIERKTIDKVLWLFVFLSFATALGSFIYYLTHFEEITESYKHAKTIPVVIEHIRYSLMLALAFFTAIALFLSSPIIKTPLAKKVLLGMAFFILAFLHILSVRSGLLALYATALVWLLFMIVRKGDKRFMLLIPAALLFPVLMYLFVPSLHNKVDYMVRDVSQFVSGKSVNNYSDGNRLLSMKIGTLIGLQHPVLGVGSGDVQQAMNEVYKVEYPDIDQKNWLIPHNQFVYLFTALGLIGLCTFILCLLYPFLNKEVLDDIICLAVLVGVYTSFLSEATLELQQGIALITFFFGLAYLRRLSA